MQNRPEDYSPDDFDENGQPRERYRHLENERVKKQDK